MAKNVIIALDFPNKKETFSFLEKFDEELFVKVGMELFYSEGPSLIEEIKGMGHKIFLDLKLHDIPNTVSSAMSSLKKLNVDMVNLHAAGGSKMMKAAIEGLTYDNEERPIIIAVTQLTSTSEELMKKELLINHNIEDVVLAYGKNAKESGLDGVVCSPLESPIIHKSCGDEFLTITPGIRFENSNIGDQVRITTPKKARELKSDYIVVGRPITKADDPVKEYKRCVNEFLGG